MPDRRHFLGTLAAAGAASLIDVPAAAAGTPAPAAAPLRQQKWDISWLEQVKAKSHKQVFDIGVLDTGGFSPLHYVHFWLNAHHDVYGTTDTQVTPIVGIAGSGFPINFKDAIWAKYPLGDHWKVMDPKTNATSKRNVFNDASDTGMTGAFMVAALQKRGTIFWMCNNALTIVSGMMADATKQTHDAVYAEFKAGLLPGVRIVPSHTMMLTACQEHGCAYQRV